MSTLRTEKGATGISRRGILRGTAALGALGYSSLLRAETLQPGTTPEQGQLASDPVAYIGKPISRVDARAKVTGAAKYAGEFNVPGLVFGSLVSSTIAKGRIASIDSSDALRISGVLDVLTHMKRPRMADTDAAHKDDVAPEGSPFRPLYDDKIAFNGQPIALVLAENWESAKFAASLVKVEYEQEPHVTDLFSERDHAFRLAADSFALKPSKPRGDADRAFELAEVRHAAEYFTPIEHHNPMELYGSTAVWEPGGKLTIYDKTQGVQNVQRYVTAALEKNPEDVRVLSPFVGGAFGSGLRPQYNVLLAAMGAIALERPVRLILTRQQMYSLGYRPAGIQRLALSASSSGVLNSLTHETIAMTSQNEAFARKDAIWSGALYKCSNTNFMHRLARLDVPTPCDMRAPGATSGVYALECAMDELAVALQLDPLELRLRNYSDRDQNADIPYSSKALRECYRQGAEAFGWGRRDPKPCSMRDGKELVGWGMATGIWEALTVKIAARVVLTADGRAEVACATSDIGTGTYTVMTQVAAEMLGLPIESVTAKLGDSTLPQSPVEGGSWIAASVSSAIAVTCAAIRDDLLTMAKAMPNSPLADAEPLDVTLADGRIVSKSDRSRGVPIADAMRHAGVERIEEEKAFEPADNGKYAQNTHSAIFAEVKIDEQLAVVRVTRVVNAVASGRIINPKTAHNQVMGSVVMGIGMALHEETLVDHRFGRIVNANFAEYHVPVHADVHDIGVIFVDEPDTIVNPLGIKGIGELGIVGTASAIANAIYHATGKRVRDLPITLDKLLPALAPA